MKSPSLTPIAALVGLLLVTGVALAQVNQTSAPKPWTPLPHWRLEPPMEYTGLTEPTQTVIQSAAELKTLWDQIWSTSSQPPPMPTIDFKREAVVVFALGGRSSGGYRVRIDGLMYLAESLDITVSTTSPGKGCVVTLALTAPVDMIRIDAPLKPPNFRVRSHVMDCSTLEKP